MWQGACKPLQEPVFPGEWEQTAAAALLEVKLIDLQPASHGGIVETNPVAYE